MSEQLEIPKPPRKPSYVKVERQMRAAAFADTCVRQFGNTEEILSGLNCTREAYNIWCLGLEPVPASITRILRGNAVPIPGAKPIQAGHYSGPNTRFGISTPEKDYYTVRGAAAAHNIPVDTAYMRAKRGTCGWSLTDYSDQDVVRVHEQPRGRPSKRDYRVAIEEHTELIGPKKIKNPDGTTTMQTLRTVHVPARTYPDVRTAAEAHKIPYHTAYKRLLTGAMGWRKEMV